MSPQLLEFRQFMSDPSKDHWMGVKRVLRHIEGTLAYSLKFSANGHEVDLYGFSDANWAGNVDNQHSTSKNVFRQA